MLVSHLEYLVAVKKYGSMNKAAANLFCTQPAISNAFQSLEKELECKIISRTPSGISFTPIGEQIVSDSKIILSLIDGWKELSKSSKDELRIAFARAINPQLVMNSLFTYQSLNPDINFKLIPSMRRGTSILFGDDGQNCRMGFFSRTPQELVETKQNAENLGLRIAKIKNGRFMLCFSANNPLAAKDKIYLNDIAGMKVVLKGGITGFPYVSPLLGANCDCSMAVGEHTNIMIALLNNHKLISLRPDFSLIDDSYISGGFVVSRPLENCEMEINQYLIYPKFDRMNSIERDFVEWMRTYTEIFENV